MCSIEIIRATTSYIRATTSYIRATTSYFECTLHIGPSLHTSAKIKQYLCLIFFTNQSHHQGIIAGRVAVLTIASKMYPLQRLILPLVIQLCTEIHIARALAIPSKNQCNMRHKQDKSKRHRVPLFSDTMLSMTSRDF